MHVDQELADLRSKHRQALTVQFEAAKKRRQEMREVVWRLFCLLCSYVHHLLLTIKRFRNAKRRRPRKHISSAGVLELLLVTLLGTWVMLSAALLGTLWKTLFLENCAICWETGLGACRKARSTASCRRASKPKRSILRTKLPMSSPQ